jgi:biopolymer transport protein ExbB/TolQ
MKAHLVVIIVTALAAVTCGATFLLALFRQFGLVEVAASLDAGAEVFFLSSSIGDLLEDREEPNRTRFLAALGLTVAIVMYLLIMRFKESAGE